MFFVIIRSLLFPSHYEIFPLFDISKFWDEKNDIKIKNIYKNKRDDEKNDIKIKIYIKTRGTGDDW